MAVVIVLALLLSACGGGGTGLIQPPPAVLIADDERLAALRAFNERFNEWHGAWVDARERGCNSQPGTLQKSYPAPVKGSRSFRQFFRFSMLHHS